MSKNNKKNILYLCKCSTNVSNFVDFDKITEWAKEKRDFDIIEIANLLCSPAEKDMFAEKIKGDDIDNIFIAACSPKLHEKTFQDIAEKQNKNISKIRMINIREQCAWVTKDINEATKKSIALINGSLKRSEFSEDLFRKSMEVNSDVVIIGGGIAGIQAARLMSKAGRKVYIIEKNISIGGSVIKTEEVAPNMECAPCLLSPLLSDIRDDKNITVLSNSVITDILGFFGNFTVKGVKKPRFVESSCMACEECFEVCPVSADNEFQNNLGKRKAIYTLFAGSVPGSAIIDKDICKHFVDNSCNECVTVCPFNSINFNDKEELFEINAGAIIISTGFDAYNLEKFDQYGYKKIDNVYTTSDIERLGSTNGPSGGEILLNNGQKPNDIAVIHCAGSLRDDGLTYCSGICCGLSVKMGELLRKSNPDAKVTNFHKDLVFPGPKEYEFFHKQKEEGTEFIEVNDLTSIRLISENEKIIVDGTGFEKKSFDMVILSNGLIPAKGTKELSELINADLDSFGYFKHDHEILHETGSIIDGVYLAGCSSKPCNISTAVSLSQAVCGDILGKLVPGKEIELEIMTANINDEKCSGCKICISVCPYKAIVFDKDKKISIINEAICRGCGTCVANCPSGASSAKNFTDQQMFAEIGGIINV